MRCYDESWALTLSFAVYEPHQGRYKKGRSKGRH
jgi:hypothetical protein